MNIWNRFLALPFAVVALLGALVCGSVQAGVVDCHPTSLTLVSNTVDCEKSSATQDFLNTNPMTVNAEQFFGFNDWVFLDKDEMGDNAGQSGNWAVDPSIWDDYSNLLLVFKDGKDTTLLGYLAANGASSGTWESPFREPEFDVNPDSKIKDVSHISYYVRGAVTRVPDTGSIVLMLIGLAFLGFSRARVNQI